MITSLHSFLFGLLTAAGLTAALFFLRFWRHTADRLFIYFAAAFFALAVNWLALAMTDPASENRYYAFLLRLVAFGCIIYGIFEKNRSSKRAPSGSPSR